jgi:hypothetical protein
MFGSGFYMAGDLNENFAECAGISINGLPGQSAEVAPQHG